MTVENNKNVVAYVRSNVVDEFIQNQISECLEYAKKNSYTISNLYVETNDNEKLVLLLNDIQNEYVDIVLTFSYDVLSKDRVKLSRILHFFHSHNIELKCIKEENLLGDVVSAKYLKKHFRDEVRQ